MTVGDGTHLVGLAGEEHCAVAYSEGALLLLALLIDLGDGPCLDGTRLRFRFALVDQLFGVGICRLWRLQRL